MYKEILEESWVYQQIKKQARDEGLSEGRDVGLSQGLSQGEQRALLVVIQRRFPEIIDTAAELVQRATDAAILENLIADVSVAQDAQEALRVLSALDQHSQGI